MWLNFLSPQRSCWPVSGGCLHDRNSRNVFNEPIFKSPGGRLNSQVSIKKPPFHFKVTQLIWSTELCSATDHLAQETRLSKTEVDCWFSERRGLRDNMEKALLTMASKNTEDRGDRPGALLNGASHHREQDGKSLRTSPHPPVLSSSSSSSSPPVLAVSSPHPPTLSSSASPPILTSSSSSSPHPPILSASTSPAPINSRSLTLLREVREGKHISTDTDQMTTYSKL